MSSCCILRMPASCGELFQGRILGKEKLISYPVNLYNYLTLEKRRGKAFNIKKENRFYNLPDKMLSLIKTAACDLGVTTSLLAEYSWQHRQLIPAGKGLASSTADLMLALTALSLISRQMLSYQDILDYLTAIEPTDSIIFPELTLLEQNNGSYWQQIGQPEGKVKVFALAQRGFCDTLNHRKLRNKIPDVTESWQLFQQGVEEQDWFLIGKAATFSARAWQQHLYYPGLEKIITLAEKKGCLGVNIAHSGNVLGILYQPHKVNIDGLKSALITSELKSYYPVSWDFELVKGGVEIFLDNRQQFDKINFTGYLSDNPVI